MLVGGIVSDAAAQTKPVWRSASKIASLPDTVGSSGQNKESRFLIERVDPESTFEVVVGRPTVLRFREPPFRDQVGDPSVVSLQSISESEISVTGEQVGSTTLNFWFKDSQTGKQEILSYLVRVTEDPQ